MAAQVPVRRVRIHQAGTAAFFSVQTEHAEKTFVFDTKSLKSVAGILRVVERTAKSAQSPRMPRLFFEADGSLRIEDAD